MVQEREGVYVGCRVDPETKAKFEELAHQRRTTVSALLRQEIDELLDEADVDLDDSPVKAEP